MAEPLSICVLTRECIRIIGNLIRDDMECRSRGISFGEAKEMGITEGRYVEVEVRPKDLLPTSETLDRLIVPMAHSLYSMIDLHPVIVRQSAGGDDTQWTDDFRGVSVRGNLIFRPSEDRTYLSFMMIARWKPSE